MKSHESNLLQEENLGERGEFESQMCKQSKLLDVPGQQALNERESDSETHCPHPEPNAPVELSRWDEVTLALTNPSPGHCYSSYI